MVDEAGILLYPGLNPKFLKKGGSMLVSNFMFPLFTALLPTIMAIVSAVSCGAQEARPSGAERRIKLKNLLQKEKYLMVPGVYDAVSARLVEKAGFPVVYIGSYSTAASQFGLPDDLMVGLPEMVEKARTVVNATSIPVLADGENGFNHAANIWRTVQAFEQAGASGIHIEDHEFGKHTDLPKVILPLPQMLGKISAAVDARQDPNFLIIARTDIISATGDSQEAIRRTNAFMEAGADLVFITEMPLDKLQEHRNQIAGKVMITHSGKAAIDEELAGANIVLYYDLSLSVAYQALKKALARLRETKDIRQLSDLLYNENEFTDFIGTPDFVRKVNKYLK
jgi:2-methylisocitrate lyase-like PEP mutase family enzyme